MANKQWILSLLAVMSLSAGAQSNEPTIADLQQAIEVHDAARVAYLFREKRFDPNFYLPNGETPLVYAIRMDADIIVNKVLLRHRQLNVKIPTLRGETPLMLAAIKGDTALVQTLLFMGADINVNFGWTALHYAATSGSSETVRLLIKNGADLNALTDRQITPLYMAARAISTDSVKALLDAGADKTICNDQGVSPADIARQRGDSELAKALAIDACRDMTPETQEVVITPENVSENEPQQGNTNNAQNPAS